jgi:predicted RNA polymerase sigma factor
MAPDTHRAIDAVWRIESPRRIAGLARIVHDIGLAEDLAYDAMVAALEQWPESGVPHNPGAWRAEFERAASLTLKTRERELLFERARTCGGGEAPPESPGGDPGEAKGRSQ